MRTTLDLDEDVLLAATEMALHEHLSAGQVISRLARAALTLRRDSTLTATSVGGFKPLAGRGLLVSNDQVNALREIEGV
jgi:hypothetical protein